MLPGERALKRSGSEAGCMSIDTVIAGGQVVSATDVRDASIAIDDGEIIAIGRESSLPDADERIDASGMLVLPGIVDPHVHIDETIDAHAGTMESETAAAALGGVTTIIDFAWQGGREADDEALLNGIEIKAGRAPRSHVDFGLHGVFDRESSESLRAIPTAIDAGVTSFKVFMSTYDWGVSNGFIHRAYESIADAGAVALTHTEDPSVCHELAEQLQAAGKGDAEWFPDSRPDYAEAMAAEDAVRMAREIGVQYYGVHTTCRQSADVIADFQVDGSGIRGETCTHYTALTRDAHEEQGHFPMIAPPLRTADDIDAMFDALTRGVLTVVSTDHIAYSRASKETAAWWDAPYGANSLQFSLPVFHHEAVNERGLSYPFLVRVMAANPARTFGLARKGTLEVGTDADIVVFDPTETVTLSAADGASRAGFSIYEGKEVTGTVKHTLVRGQQVVANGRVVGEAGDGRFVERAVPEWTPFG